VLQAALNGARTDDEHPAIPRTPQQLAAAGQASAAAGAQVLHVHAFDEEGRESLAAAPTDATLRALRAACPGIPLSLTTREGIEPDTERRHALIAAWNELPELVTVNFEEEGADALCEHLIGRGVGIEAGLLAVADAERFAQSPVTRRCTRVMIEPLDLDPERALADAAAMQRIVAEAGIDLPQVHHGDGIACWAVNERAARLGHGIRTGLEDVTVLPDGSQAPDNAALVAAAAGLLAAR
jgi:uncharacterized protein (DUF849 family)